MFAHNRFQVMTVQGFRLARVRYSGPAALTAAKATSGRSTGPMPPSSHDPSQNLSEPGTNPNHLTIMT